MNNDEIEAALAQLPPIADIETELRQANDQLATARELVSLAAARYNDYNRLQQMLLENKARPPNDPTRKQISMSQVRGALKRYGLTYLKRTGPAALYDSGYTIDYQPYASLAHFDQVSVRYHARATQRVVDDPNYFGLIQRDRLHNFCLSLKNDFPELEHDLTQHHLGYWLLWLGRYKVNDR